MTASRLIPPAVDPASLPRDLPGLRAHFRPVVEEIARGALERDRARLLPFEAVRALVAPASPCCACRGRPAAPTSTCAP